MFAVFLILGLGVVLITSTLLESSFGTVFVQKFFYQSGWFDVFLGLFAVNIFCSTANRWPFKKSHTGFVVTHIGILVLLAGCFMARLGSVEGQMSLYETETGDRILMQGYDLTVHKPDHKTATYPVANRLGARSESYKIEGTAYKLIMSAMNDKARGVTEIREGSPQDPVNRAIVFRLESEMAGVKKTYQLIEQNPLDPKSNKINEGPAQFELREKAIEGVKDAVDAAREPSLLFADKKSGKVFTVLIHGAEAKALPIGKTGFHIENITYYPDARVGDEQGLVSVSDEPNNPAVRFDVVDSQGKRDKLTRFALFPDFESMHESGQKKESAYTVQFVIPGAESATASSAPTGLIFHPGAPWTYTAHSKKGDISGTVKMGETFSAGWMDFKITVDKIYEHTIVERKVAFALSGTPAVKVRLERSGRSLGEKWVMADEAATIETPDGHFLLGMTRRTAETPFRLTLKDFRKVDYPGTRNAASYESDVMLEDPVQRIKIEKTIKMNEPLDYGGYRIFQSSFLQSASDGEASVFTVAKNPGILMIYLGTIIIFTGAAIVFYVRPLSSLSIRRSFREKK
jgi:hypothetical protein